MALNAHSAAAEAHGEITVAYFLEWPMPMMVAKASGAYDEALGMKVNWVSFETGTAMSAAMASGDVHIAVSQGVPPFVVATSGGQDLQTVDVAVSYSDNDNCVVRADLEIDKDSASELAGKKGLYSLIRRSVSFPRSALAINASCSSMANPFPMHWHAFPLKARPAATSLPAAARRVSH